MSPLAGGSDPREIVRRGYDLVSRTYRADDAAPGQYGPWLDLLDARLEPGAAILDLGCGCGIPVAQRLAQRHMVTGVDVSPVQIARARELVPRASFIRADMTDLTLGDASFDAILCLFSLIHVPLPAQPAVLRNIGRWLRPGGLFMATVGHRSWTGVEADWLGVPGADMWWSHADTATYRGWLEESRLRVEREAFVPEGDAGHTFVLAIRDR